jgi:hypothetical protein
MKWFCFILLCIVVAGYACTTSAPPTVAWVKADLHPRCVMPESGTAALAALEAWCIRNGYGVAVVDTACGLLPPYQSGPVLLNGSNCADENGVHTTALNTCTRIWTAAALREAVRTGLTSPNILTYIPQTPADLLAHHVRNIDRANGLALLSRHTLNVLPPAVLAETEGLKWIEIFDGDTLTEAPWDSLLTRGKHIFAVASDTSFNGRAWVVLRPDSLTPSGVVKALHQGNFYASSGVMLAEITHQQSEIGMHLAVTVDTAATREQLALHVHRRMAIDTSRIQITFITAGGDTAKQVTAHRARHSLKPDALYVRARITYALSDTVSYHAWTQPLYRIF